MAITKTVTKPTGVQDTVFGNKRILIRDVTLDTGTYVTGGNTITATELGLKRIELVTMGTNVMTGGTAGATGNPIGIRYASDGTSVTFQQYEAAATGLPLLEKTSAEATVANATFRVMFVGF